MSYDYIIIKGLKSMEIDSYLPLSEPVFYILLSLAAESRHGYAIMKDVRLISQERVDLSTGTLYGALKRMMEAGWILQTADQGNDESLRNRKSYALTNLGKRVLKAEIERLNHLVRAAALLNSEAGTSM
jgi:DNA-binding PadR family transcriptional regulator